MSSSANRYYVTTPIYYVNDRPHIGHVYTTTVADVLARYHRLLGDETFFLTGTDEHATKIVDAAAANGVGTQEWADRNAAVFEKTFQALGLSNDDFIRTSQERHKKRVLGYIQTLMDSDDVYEGQYEGWYDAGQEEYVPENKAKEYDYKSPVNDKPLIRKTETNYFFRLSRYQQPLLKLLAVSTFSRRLGKTRSPPVFRKGSTTCRSPGRAWATGASKSPATPTMRSTSGSTRCSTTTAPSIPTSDENSGRPTCT